MERMGVILFQGGLEVGLLLVVLLLTVLGGGSSWMHTESRCGIEFRSVSCLISGVLRDARENCLRT